MKIFIIVLIFFAAISCGNGHFKFSSHSSDSFAGINAGASAGGVSGSYGRGYGGSVSRHTTAGLGSYATVPSNLYSAPKVSYGVVGGGYNGRPDNVLDHKSLGGYGSGVSGVWAGKSFGGCNSIGLNSSGYSPSRTGGWAGKSIRGFGGRANYGSGNTGRLGGHSRYDVGGTSSWPGKSISNFGRPAGYGSINSGPASSVSSSSTGWW